MSNYRLSPVYRLDQSSSVKAVEELQQFINNYPSSPRVDEANELIEELRAKMELKAFEQGMLYYDLKNYNSAIASFENMIKDYPETEKGEDVRFLIIQSSYNWASKSIYEKREGRLNKTLELIDKFKKKYPTSIHSADCQKINTQCKIDLKTFENE